MLNVLYSYINTVQNVCSAQYGHLPYVLNFMLSRYIVFRWFQFPLLLVASLLHGTCAVISIVRFIIYNYYYFTLLL